MVTVDTCFYAYKWHGKNSGFEAGDAVFLVEKFHAELVGKEIKETGTDHREQDRDGQSDLQDFLQFSGRPLAI